MEAATKFESDGLSVALPYEAMAQAQKDAFDRRQGISKSDRDRIALQTQQPINSSAAVAAPRRPRP